MERRVVCAANKMPNGLIICGARHWDKIMRAQADALNIKGGREEQGFIDQLGNFMTREEALQVAKANGQIIRRCGGDDRELFSENLY